MSADVLRNQATPQVDRRLSLCDVTLIAVSSVALPATVRALRLSQRDIAFGDVILFSDRSPAPENLTWLRWQPVEPIRSRRTYSQFMTRGLAGFIRTSHVLCVQWDGYVLHADAWDPAFLDFDYIGAPWPHFADQNNVGNGGFSLRSQRLIEAVATLPGDADEAEDIAICRTHRPVLEEQYAMRFAPEEVAHRFSYERCTPSGDTFGFHGFFNMVDFVEPAELTAMIDPLELDLLTWAEHVEILRGMVGRGYYRLVLAMLIRMLRVRWRRSVTKKSGLKER